MAVLVFVFFPRGAGSTFLGPMQASPSQALSGFNDQVGYQDIARITRSEDVVARVELYHKGELVTHPLQLLLRGSVLDTYTGSDVSRGRWHWTRSVSREMPTDSDNVTGVGGVLLPTEGDSGDRWKQVINLQPTATNKLFAMAGPINISSRHEMQITYSRDDEVLEANPPILQPIEYTVVSTNELPTTAEPVKHGSDGSEIDPAVAGYARQPAVCGTDAAGKSLAEYPLAGDHQYDHEIASNFERDLRTHFGYTLDLTNIGSLGDRDPMVAFLTDFRRGHCEYFAGAMTLMCQSLDIPADSSSVFAASPRISIPWEITFRSSSQTPTPGVKCSPEKWESFDPTSGRGVEGTASHPFLTDLKKVFDYLEFKWASSVVAYDTSNRKNLIDTLDTQLSKTAVNGSQNVQDWVAWIQKQLDAVQRGFASPTVLSSVITGMILLSVLAVSIFVFERLRLHRRARRIGIELLSAPDQYRLARQLRFYDDLLRILAKHRIEAAAPPHAPGIQPYPLLSPRRCVQGRLPPHRTFLSDPIRREIPPAHPRRHLSAVIYRIQQSLDGGASDQPWTR